VRTDVRCLGNGLTRAGRLHTPGTGADRSPPAIVVVHPWSGVKEQTAGRYDRRLAQRGFDATRRPEKEGDPCFLETPLQRADDIKSAVRHLSTLKYVAPDRIGAFGIRTRGGHAVYPTMSDHRIRAVGTVSYADIGIVLHDGLDGGQTPAVFRDLVNRAGQLRVEEALGEPARLEHILAVEVDETTPDHVRQGHEYDRTPRGGHPRSENARVLRSVAHIAPYGVERRAPCPLLTVVGRAAATACFSPPPRPPSAGRPSRGPGNRRSLPSSPRS
jgi:uncharacterized protein